MRVSIQLEEVRGLLSEHHQGFSFDWLSADILEIAIKIGQDLMDYSREFWQGLYADFLKRSSQSDVGIKCYKHVKEIPIVDISPDIRLIKKDKRPSNKRKRAPKYDEIRKLWHLTSRETWLAEQEELINIAATKLGRSILALTPSVAPIKHYPANFMSAPAKAPGNPREMNVKAAIRDVASKQHYENIVTIWCENSKAMQRYATEFTRKIFIVYPQGYIVSEFDTQLSYLKSNYPLIEVVKIHSVSEERLRASTSEWFVKEYFLPVDSLFCINFLPQFIHLRTEFSSFMCVYSDTSTMSNSIQLSFPEVSGTMSEQLNYYNSWIIENYPDEISDGHCGFFDELLGLRLSYSQHGTFLDYIPTPDSMIGSDYRTLRLADYLGLESQQPLRIALPHHCFDDFQEDDVDLFIDSLDYDVHTSIDVSCITMPAKVLYVPAYRYTEARVGIDGYLDFATFRIDGLDIGRVYRVVVIEDSLKILDVSYSKQNYYRRQSSIPKELRFIPSSVQRAPLSYVIFPQTRSLVGDYSVDLQKKFNYYSSPSVQNVSYFQYIVPGFAWNSSINAAVWDVDAYIYLTSLNMPEVPKAKHVRSYEFASSAALRKAKRFKIHNLYGTIVESSSEDRVTSAGLSEVLSTTSLPPRIVSALSIVMVLWSADAADDTLFVTDYDHELIDDGSDDSGYHLVGCDYLLSNSKFFYRGPQFKMVQGDVLDLRLSDNYEYFYFGHSFSSIYARA